MPPRRKPTSTRQKKADQQLRRAVKRGDVPPPEVNKSNIRRKKKIGPTGRPISGAVQSVKALQSAFTKESPKFLEETKVLASDLPLSRPVPGSKAVYQLVDQTWGDQSFPTLSCPKRPKWRYDQSKLEVERNEEGIFKKWLTATDEAIANWQSRSPTEGHRMPYSTSHFERNIEVWRQLWRVTEISDIILVLLDSRCPLLHFPPSLSAYFKDKKVILVLTKIDIPGRVRVQAWIKYFRDFHPNLRIVQVESYVEKEGTAEQGRKLYEPYISTAFRESLVHAIREVHAELLEPPDKVKQHPDRLQNWVPPVKIEIDWESVLNPKGDRVGLSVGGAALPRSKSPDDTQNPDQRQSRELTYLTIGLVGQPNVGKSSLLNALFGENRVHASKTPGKTKHFQTLYWSSDVRLVDCPGLVMPNYTPMEMQVLSGVLPISRVSAIPACSFHVAELLPHERVYNLVHPGAQSIPAVDKRTWRATNGSEQSKLNAAPLTVWTAMDMLTAYADKKGWATAKAGRSDVNRAGNAILRSLAEGRVGWAFWPPGTDVGQLADAEGHGIWIPRVDDVDHEGTCESESESDERGGIDDEMSVSDDVSDDEENVDLRGDAPVLGLGRFGALSIGSDVEEE